MRTRNKDIEKGIKWNRRRVDKLSDEESDEAEFVDGYEPAKVTRNEPHTSDSLEEGEDILSVADREEWKSDDEDDGCVSGDYSDSAYSSSGNDTDELVLEAEYVREVERATKKAKRRHRKVTRRKRGPGFGNGDTVPRQRRRLRKGGSSASQRETRPTGRDTAAVAMGEAPTGSDSEECEWGSEQKVAVEEKQERAKREGEGEEEAASHPFEGACLSYEDPDSGVIIFSQTC